ncbi:MAG: polysaccharide deacetylase family protein [Casimicrobiaceae bacterium]
MSGWESLATELDAWAATGMRARLWCRDDDATDASPALQRLLDTAGATEVPVPVTLAAIPERLAPGLVAAVERAPLATIVQHGCGHRNHAPPGERSAELGAHRPLEQTLAALRAGRDRLVAVFGNRFFPALVPPWNRIDPAVVQALPTVGHVALSTFGPRTDPYPAPGLLQANTHVDLIAWRSGRGFIGEARALARLVDHLAGRRTGRDDRDEATGILTHHLDLDNAAWTFLGELFRRTGTHPAVAWEAAPAVFATATRKSPPVTSARQA